MKDILRAMRRAVHTGLQLNPCWWPKIFIDSFNESQKARKGQEWADLHKAASPTAKLLSSEIIFTIDAVIISRNDSPRTRRSWRHLHSQTFNSNHGFWNCGLRWKKCLFIFFRMEKSKYQSILKPNKESNFAMTKSQLSHWQFCVYTIRNTSPYHKESLGNLRLQFANFDLPPSDHYLIQIWNLKVYANNQNKQLTVLCLRQRERQILLTRFFRRAPFAFTCRLYLLNFFSEYIISYDNNRTATDVKISVLHLREPKFIKIIVRRLRVGAFLSDRQSTSLFSVYYPK